MTTVIIQSAETALYAGAWANKNIKHKWDIQLDNFHNNLARYIFKFSDSHDATHFALKWAGING